jgi:hypothetical protein
MGQPKDFGPQFVGLAILTYSPLIFSLEKAHFSCSLLKNGPFLVFRNLFSATAQKGKINKFSRSLFY